jgi:hypothetical protein
MTPSAGQTPENSYRVMSVSNLFDQDCEYWIPYSTELIQPGMTLTYGKTFADCINQNNLDPPLAAQLAAYVLMDIHDVYGRTYLIFARNTLPSADLIQKPSAVWAKSKTWDWPTVWRNFTYNFDVGPPLSNGAGGNLNAVTILPNLCKGGRFPTIHRISQWWTSQPWPEYLINVMARALAPSVVQWNYFNVAEGSVNCLHGRIDMPPLTGIGSIRGNPGVTRNIQGQTTPATTPATWAPDRVDFNQEQIRGRWMAELTLAIPPWNPLIYPQNPFFYSS